MLSYTVSRWNVFWDTVYKYLKVQVSFSHAACWSRVWDLCVRSCVDCNFSTSVTSVDIKLYRYFLLCLSLVTEDITKWYNTRTSIKVDYNVSFMFEKFSTFSAAEMFDIRVTQLMRFQFICCTETLWTFTANIWLHTFMRTKYMCLKVTTQGEFLLTNVTSEPNPFIMWLQQMCLELAIKCKTFWTVSTWVRLCTSVSTNMLFQITATFKQPPTVTTVIRSSVAVCMTFVCLQIAGLAETLVTQWTLVWFVSCVDSHVSD